MRRLGAGIFAIICVFSSSIVSHLNEKDLQAFKAIFHGIATNSSDATQPNPNGVDFDNFYLDMNGIIHPCCHPEDKPAPRNEDEMMANIFEYIDRLFGIVRPRRLLYMAIDGVAPRAKMNQQRSRRFRAAKDSQELQDQIKSVRDELATQGIPLPPKRRADEHFDSNCITPGTPFMSRLGVCLRYYVHERLNNDPAWKNLIVILSDASSPGEGEHKIMDYIRKQRASPGHDPNTQHVLCGADADLIMLGLATHEPNFTIIREEFVPNTQKPCDLCHQYGHALKDCQGLSAIQSGEYGEVAKMCQRDKNFIFIRLSVLREYLSRDLAMPNLPFTYDFERVIDDWGFMCFFVRNDFLPHLPSLEIREGAIDRFIKLYKEAVYKTGGYLTDSGLVELSRVQLIMSELGGVEDEIFRTRQHNELQYRQREKDKRQRMKAQAAAAPSYIPNNAFGPSAPGRFGDPNPMSGSNARQTAYEMRKANLANEDAAKALRAQIGAPPTEFGQPPASIASDADRPAIGVKRKHEETAEEDEEDEEPKDEVRLWEEGWKERYYQSKFEVSSEDTQFRFKVARAYVEGFCWVLRYYYQGVPDWSWFYPYHYAPFASDFMDIGGLKPNFDEESKPVAPLVQLMSVFPAASRKHLPIAWANLMINKDSPIIDFYPCNFQVDLNGKKFAWQGVALLPFVDSDRLADTLEEVQEFLSDEELARNQRGENELFVSGSHLAHEFFGTIYENKNGGEKEEKMDETTNGTESWIQIDSSLTHGISGTIASDIEFVPAGGSLKSAIKGFPAILNNHAIVILNKDSSFPAAYRYSGTAPELSLKPREWNDRSGDRYRPQVGFNRNSPRAELDMSGKRMVWNGLGGPANMQRQDYRQGGRDSQSYQAGGNHGGNYDNRSRNNNYGQQQHDSNRYTTLIIGLLSMAAARSKGLRLAIVIAATMCGAAAAPPQLPVRHLCTECIDGTDPETETCFKLVSCAGRPDSTAPFECPCMPTTKKNETTTKVTTMKTNTTTTNPPTREPSSPNQILRFALLAVAICSIGTACAVGAFYAWCSRANTATAAPSAIATAAAPSSIATATAPSSIATAAAPSSIATAAAAAAASTSGDTGVRSVQLEGPKTSANVASGTSIHVQDERSAVYQHTQKHEDHAYFRQKECHEGHPLGHGVTDPHVL